MESDSRKIRDVEIPSRVIVAPMAGIPNATFRVVCKEFGADLMVYEMISDHGIIYRNEKTLEMLIVDPRGHPINIQISGGSEETSVEAAHYVDTHTATDIISINVGCPIPKATKTGAGTRWLLDPNKIYQMVHAIVRNVSKSIAVKMRTGWSQKRIFAVENILATQEANVSTVTMRERARKQIYMEEADWETLKEAAGALTIPFVGNGSVTTPEEAKAMLEDVGADTVVVGRATLGDSWIIKDMVHYLDISEKLRLQTAEEKVATAKEQLNGLIDLKGEKIAVPKFRRQAAYYLRGIPHSARTRAKINDAWAKQEVFDLLNDFVGKYETR